MSATNFSTDNSTFRQLMGNGLTYRIPRFQRDYSWDERHWEDLWTDICNTLPASGEPAHYMGYLVLKTTDNRHFEVIDGQQRLTTISLIVLAAMRLLKKYSADRLSPDSKNNAQRKQQLRSSYIGYLDPVTLSSHNKLQLNRNNDEYYKDYLVTLADHLPQRGFRASTHTMRQSFEWFEEHLQARVKDDPNAGRALAQLVETMSDKLFFTVITVSDELNAYKVFETLNARGVRLSSTDLLKNYLFSVLARSEDRDHELSELERRWESMVERLGQESFPNFLRMHWNSRKTFTRQSELFKTVRQHIHHRQDVFELLQNMDEDIDAYLALIQPEGSNWMPEWKQNAQTLRMFSVRQPIPMLMAAKRYLSEPDFGRLLNATVVIAFRYNVIGARRTGKQEHIYHRTALKLQESPPPALHDVIGSLHAIYLSDQEFRADFADKSIKTTQSRNAKVVRYILCQLELQAEGSPIHIESPDISIEHILPQSPDADWDAFDDRDLENFVYRLGNMVLLETSKNKSIKSLPYSAKRPILQSSAVSLTRRLAESYEAWTPEKISTWQRELARIATTVWRIDALS